MKEYPFWFKSAVILVGLTFLGYVLIQGKFILMPLAFSALFAVLLSPVSRRLEQWKLGRVGSIVVPMVVVAVVLSGILSLFTWQFVQFAEDLPQVTQRVKEITSRILEFAESTIGVAPEQQTEYIRKGLDNLIDRSGEYVTGLVTTTTNLFTILGLMPVFVFLLMYYREMYDIFLKQVLRDKSGSDVDALLRKIKSVVQNYLVGLITVILILAVLNSVGLLIVGIENAVFFGVFAAFMAVIPYIGIIIGGFPPLVYALFTTDSLIYPLGVIIVFVVVQFLEGNFITPRVIGSKVSINAFMAIIALIIGGQIWGISGMILFVPLLGILRVVFEELPGLRPVGYLFGNKIEYDE